MPTPSRYIICLGSNVESRTKHINDAIAALAQVSTQSPSASEMCEMPSYNGIGDPYINCVIAGQTDLTLERLQAYAKQIEDCAGRTPGSKLQGIVPIDVDIVVWQGKVINVDEFRRAYFRICFNNLNSLLTTGSDPTQK